MANIKAIITSDALEHGKKGILVGYDDCQGPLLLAKIYFPDLRILIFMIMHILNIKTFRWN